MSEIKNYVEHFITYCTLTVIFYRHLVLFLDVPNGSVRAIIPAILAVSSSWWICNKLAEKGGEQ